MVTLTLDSVIREAMIEFGHTNENMYARMLQHGISGLREFNMDLAQNGDGVPTPVVLPVSSNMTVALPKDYIKYVRIGLIDALGNIYDLSYNGAIRWGNPVNSCGQPVNPSNNNLSVAELSQAQQAAMVNGTQPGPLNAGFVWTWDGFADNFRNAELVGRFFGIGGGTNSNGYYRVNLQKGWIELGGVAATNIFLEYLSDLQFVDGQYMVHPFVVEALKSYIYWKLNQRNSKQNGIVKQESRSEYYNEFFKAKARFNTHTVREYMDAFRFSNKMAPKM